MALDYLAELRYLGLISRIKRLSDNTIADGRKLYQYIDIGIEPNWFLIFRIIIEKGETSVTEISSILQFAHPSVISIIKKMNAAGYLKIAVSEVDKRKQIIQLSDKAKKQLPEMQNVWKACEAAVESLFTDDVLISELEKMENELKKESFFNRALNYLNQYDIKIEPFASKDSKQFALLNQEWLNKYFTLEPIDKIVLNNPTKYILEKGGHIIMAHYRDQTVGTVALIPKSKTEIELSRMAVTPEHHGKGMGKKLIEKAINLAKEESYSSIFLYSNTKLKPAINLYIKYGFKKESIETNPIYNRANIKMRLKL